MIELEELPSARVTGTCVLGRPRLPLPCSPYPCGSCSFPPVWDGESEAGKVSATASS